MRRHRPAERIVHPAAIGADQGNGVDLGHPFRAAAQEFMHLLLASALRNACGGHAQPLMRS